MIPIMTTAETIGMVAVIVTGVGVLTALGIGITTLIHSSSLRRKEYKARLLDDLRGWAKEVDAVFMPTIPRFADLIEAQNLGEGATKTLRALAASETSFKKSLVIGDSAYFRVMAEKVFPTRFSDLFWVIDREFPALAFLETGTPPEEHLSAIVDEVVAELKKVMAAGEATREDLLLRHHDQLRSTLTLAVAKIAEIKAELM